jgi:hypothetical protein
MPLQHALQHLRRAPEEATIVARSTLRDACNASASARTATGAAAASGGYPSTPVLMAGKVTW